MEQGRSWHRGYCMRGDEHSAVGTTEQGSGSSCGRTGLAQMGWARDTRQGLRPQRADGAWLLELGGRSQP